MDDLKRRHRLSALRFDGRAPPLLLDPIVQCVIYLLVVSAIFVAIPGIDLWFSGLFYEAGQGFPVNRLAAFRALRDVGRWSTAIVPAVLIAAIIVKLARPDRPTPIAPAAITFLLVTLAVGPGLVTNLIFKSNWGRPRPINVDAFGGQFPFVPAWYVSDYCSTNCSFVSGEASSAIWLLGLALLVPVVWRPTAVKWLVGLIVALSLNRIAYGGHFLSDVLLAWGTTFLVMAIVYRFAVERPPAWLTNERQEERLTRLGHRIRDAAKGLPGIGKGRTGG